VPLFVLIKLKRNKDSLNSEELRSKYTFFSKGYISKSYYWGFIILIRKYLLLAIVIFGANWPVTLQVYLSLYVILFSYILQAKHKPYINDLLNRFEVKGLICAGIFNFTGFYYYSIDRTPFWTFVFVAISISSQCYFLVTWGLEFVKTQKNLLKRNRKIMRLYRSIIKIMKKVCKKRKPREIEMVTSVETDRNVKKRRNLTS